MLNACATTATDPCRVMHPSALHPINIIKNKRKKNTQCNTPKSRVPPENQPLTSSFSLPSRK